MAARGPNWKLLLDDRLPGLDVFLRANSEVETDCFAAKLVLHNEEECKAILQAARAANNIISDNLSLHHVQEALAEIGKCILTETERWKSDILPKSQTWPWCIWLTVMLTGQVSTSQWIKDLAQNEPSVLYSIYRQSVLYIKAAFVKALDGPTGKLVDDDCLPGLNVALNAGKEVDTYCFANTLVLHNKNRCKAILQAARVANDAIQDKHLSQAQEAMADLGECILTETEKMDPAKMSQVALLNLADYKAGATTEEYKKWIKNFVENFPADFLFFSDASVSYIKDAYIEALKLLEDPQK